MEKQRRELHWIDFIILSIIFFGYATYGAISIYFSDVSSSIDAESFTNNDNYFAIITEIVILVIALIYLLIRKFDFKLINFSVNKRTIPLALLLIFLGSVATDLVVYGNYWLTTDYTLSELISSQESLSNMFGNITISLMLFSLLNGFYEELFFMGLTFSIQDKFRKYVIIGSIFIRFIFHIYQGIPSALGIALAGLFFILVRRRVSSIIPFIIAHAVFDMFGAGIFSLIFSMFN